MKILVLGDTHGYPTWKKIIEKEKPEKVIFLGDYLDSFDRTPGSSERMIENMKEIFSLPNAIRLIGNHEFHYLFSDIEYSGKRNDLCRIAPKLLREWIKEEKLILSYRHGNYLFSHAGFTNLWWKKQVDNFELDEKDPTSFKIKDLNDSSLLKSLDIVIFYNDPIKGVIKSFYGDTPNEGPLWIRPNSLMKDPLNGFKQVVGHTHSKEPLELVISENTKIHTLDCLDNGYYGLIEDDTFIDCNLEIRKLS